MNNPPRTGMAVAMAGFDDHRGNEETATPMISVRVMRRLNFTGRCMQVNNRIPKEKTIRPANSPIGTAKRTSDEAKNTSDLHFSGEDIQMHHATRVKPNNLGSCMSVSSSFW